ARSIGMIAFGIPSSIFFVHVLYSFWNGVRFERQLFAFTIGLFPFALAFGTNNNYWDWAVLALLFWMTAAVVFAGSAVPHGHRLRAVFPAVLASQCLVYVLMTSWMEHPYRQSTPVALQSSEVEI